MKLFVGVIIGFSLAFLVFKYLAYQNTYNLYRNSPVISESEVLIASFNAKERAEYNRDNCEIARDLFQSQQGIVTRFWCNKASF